MGANLAVELLGRRGLCAPLDADKEQFNARNCRSLTQILFFLGGDDVAYLGLRRRMREYGRMRM